MKKLIGLAIAIFMLFSSTCVYAQVTVNAEVNLRKGPGLDYDIVASVPAGTVLADGDSIITDDRGVAWYAVVYKGTSCWVSSKYASLTGSDFEPQGTSGSSSSGSSSSGSSSSGSSSSGTSSYFSVTAEVNLRKGPGLSYDVLYSAKAGTTLESAKNSKTDDRGVVWYQVYYKNTKCWVSSKYVVTENIEFESQPTSSGSSTDNIEIGSYCGQNLKDAAAAIGLTNRETVSGATQYRYYNSKISLYGNTTLSTVVLQGSGYSIYGASVGGKNYTTATNCIDNGLRMRELRSDAYVLDHYPALSSTPDGYLCIYFNSSGIIHEIMWIAYAS